jgi:ferredoxin
MTAGKLCWEGVNSYLFLDKSDFRKQYRKNSVFPFEALEYFGVYFVYRRQMQPSASYSKCDSFEIHFECGNCIALALNYLSTRLRPVDPRKGYVLSTMDLVALADYESILTDKPMDRGSIDPLDGRLMRTAGDKGGLWAGLMTALAEGRRLQPSCSMFSYTPAWLIRLSRRSECAAIFTLTADRILIEINMKYEELTRLAQAKDGLPVELCRLLGALGCIGCGRCQEAGAALETVNGVRVCQLEAYARRLAFPVNGEKDVECALFLTGWKLNTSFLPPSML